ncbi:MAG: type II secretion system major pseudopilin GspG [Gammaproteobacteria bacterium]
MRIDKEMKRRERGFTLIELLVVLVILGLLGSIVGPRVMKYLSSAKFDSAKLQIQDFAGTLDLYKLELGRYPTTDEGLKALVEQPSNAEGWNGPYLKKKEIPKDPWGNEYSYRFPGQHGEFDVYSLGADNAEGGDGENKDVASWE